MTTKITRENLTDEAYYDIAGPEYTSLVYPGVQTSTSTEGGETITINGQGFKFGLSVTVNNKTAGAVSVISSSQITFTAPANPSGIYLIYLINTNGTFILITPGLQYS